MVEWHHDSLRAEEELADSWEEGLEYPRQSGRQRSSGIFSLFRWFRREREEPPSLAGSVDTLFSTATARSFAFVHPHHYRPFGCAGQPEVRIQAGPESPTYKSRHKRFEKKISLREKYKLYASGTLPRSVDHIHELSDEHFDDLKVFLGSHPLSDNSTLGRKKRRAPPPPAKTNSEDKSNEDVQENRESSDRHIKQHRRTLSEPSKVCHVKGKRKAPPPPGNSVDSDVVSIGTSNSNSSKRSRKKRRAPSPPRNSTGNSTENGIVSIIREATNDILSEDLSVSGNESFKDETASNASTLDIGSADVVCTDTLKLERGILKPNMEKTYAEPKICPSSPVSPRPWYKRATNKDSGSVREKDKKKERDRRKVEDWMIESGFPRRSLLNYDNKYNIFSRTDKTEDKRKSQISILTNISELDREAAEIIRRGKEREKHLMDCHNAMYYNDNKPMEVKETATEIPENSRKNSARELISLFNAITNVTKSTVNPSVFPSRDMAVGPIKENKTKVPEQKYEKNFKTADNVHPVEIESLDEIVHRKFTKKPHPSTGDDDKPGTSSASTSSVNSGGKIARVTIEELDEYDAERNSKSQVLYEANKQNRHLSPLIPTINEVREGSTKSTLDDTNKTPGIVPKVSTEMKLIEVKQMNVWVCPRCTLENLRWRITCEACDMWRPNPFELREKTVTVDENKIELNNKKLKHPSETHLLYPNLSPLKKESEPSNKNSLADIQKDPLREDPSGGKDQKQAEIVVNSSKPIADQPVNKNKDIQNAVNSLAVVENKLTPEKESKQNKNLNTSIIKKELHISSDKMHLMGTSSISSSSALISTNINEISTIQEKNIGTIEENLPSEPSDSMNDEVRKARLAFFGKSVPVKNQEEKPSILEENKKVSNNLNLAECNKSIISIPKGKDEKTNQSVKIPENSQKSQQPNTLEINKQISQSTNTTVEVQTSSVSQKSEIANASDDPEKKKLKEMLIEMKHSLPKRPKPIKKQEGRKSQEQPSSDSQKVSTESFSLSNSSGHKSSFANPAPAELPSYSKSQHSKGNDYAEAYLIESETIVEEVKIKKPSEKVSSSVQTSGLVTQISPHVKPSSGKEFLIPIQVEENTIKDGILYTSVSNGFKKIGKGTFELMRPRDFANIKEVKVESKLSALPLYANVIDDTAHSSVKSEEATVNSSEYIDKLSKQLVKPQGVANFRACLGVSNDKNMNTIAVNRLLKRLEGAIVGGNHEIAAGLARELAQLKVNCSVIRQKPEKPCNEILLELYVEDKVSHQGPFHIKVKSSMTVRELKELVEREYEIPLGVQRWILANQLAGDESATLESLGVNTDGFPIFLYLVAPDLNSVKTEEVIELEVKASTSGIPSTNAQKPVKMKIVEDKLPEKKEPQPGPSGLTKTADDPPSNITEQEDINPTGTLALGWKCETCTLMNSPTRPGCAACSAGRPVVYKVPGTYKPNEAEALRIEKEQETEQQSNKSVAEEKAQNYQKLVDLEKDDLIIYSEEFDCPVCLTEYAKMEGIVLRECLHVFCRNCLANTVQFSEEAEVKCPYRDNNYTCDSTLLEREIKSLVTPQVYEEHLAKSIALAETKIGNAFHCKTPDCIGWCIYEDNVNVFKCPVCTHTNCLTCQAVHEGLNCKQYQEQLHIDSDMNIEVKRTKEMLQEMVDRGEAMNCPTCHVVLMKKWGCDWLRCSMCKTEICWITRGPRWGPNGKGDTSGGCQCGVNGIKCHPKCTYCH